jgi:hypothetical protein
VIEWWVWVILAGFAALYIWCTWPSRPKPGPERWEYEAHDCPKPNSKNRGVGSVWRCSCGKPWRIIDKRWSGANEITTWRPI